MTHRMNGTIDINPAAIAGLKRAELTAVVTRADGTVEHLGVIAATNFRPSLLSRIGDFLCRMF